MEINVKPGAFSELIKGLQEDIGRDVTQFVKDRIKGGVQPPLENKRSDGTKSTPLFKTGRHLHKSITYTTDKEGVSIGSTFKGAPFLEKKRPFLNPDKVIGIEKVIDNVIKKNGGK